MLLWLLNWNLENSKIQFENNSNRIKPKNNNITNAKL